MCIRDSIIGFSVDITERKRAEEALKEREAALEARTTELEEVNTALRVLLKLRDKDKTELEEKVMLNVKELVLPYIEKLKRRRLDAKSMAYLSVLESNFNDIVSPFIHKLSSKHASLTPSEIQIAYFVRDGRTAKEMAELLNVSRRTIDSHRQNIRIKVGLHGKKANLRSHLLSM
jgi:DNA-binding CsgD family transcriptional regulator